MFYDKPLQKFDRLLETYLAFAPAGLESFMMAMPLWLKTKLHLPREIRKALGGRYTKRIVFKGHHESHAASTFFPSRYDESAILTLDGVGKWDTATLGHGQGNKLKILKTLHFPHSLGLLYYGLVTGIGLVKRVLGSQPICKTLDRQAATYWHDAPAAPDPKRYFSQF